MANATRTINLKALKAVACAASDEGTRYYLKGVFVEFQAEAVTYTATDGHRLLAAQTAFVEGHSVSASAIVPLSLIDRIKLGKRDTGAALMRIEDKEQGTVVVTIEYLGASYSEAAIHATYPDVRCVVPASVSGEVASFNSLYLASFEKARAIATGDKLGPHIVVSHNGGSPALVNMSIFKDQHGFEIFGVIMPMRMSGALTSAPEWFVKPEAERSVAEAA